MGIEIEVLIERDYPIILYCDRIEIHRGDRTPEFEGGFDPEEKFWRFQRVA
jgi:hypothetical protein